MNCNRNGNKGVCVCVCGEKLIPTRNRNELS